MSASSVFYIDTQCPCFDRSSGGHIDDLLIAFELCIFVHFTNNRGVLVSEIDGLSNRFCIFQRNLLPLPENKIV